MWLGWIRGVAGVSVAAIGLACGSSADVGPNEDGTSDSGVASSDDGVTPTDGSGSSEAGDGVDTGTGQSSSDDGDPTVGASCEEYLDDPELGAPVTVTLENTSTETVYVRAQDISVERFVDIVSPSGESINWLSDGWTLMCQELIEGPVGCGGCACSDLALQLEPGAEWTVTWPGLLLEAATLPDECAAETDVCGPECWIRRQPQAGLWTFRIETAAELMCTSGPCECADPPVDGACTIYDFDGLVLGDTQAHEASIDYPGAVDVTITLP